MKGRAWENALRIWHDRYRAQRLAAVWRTPNEVIPMGGPNARGVFPARFGGDGPPDFMGVRQGRSLMFDAKDTEGRAWSFSDLELHQAMDLEAHQVNGGLAFLVVRTSAGSFVATWSRLGPRWWAWHETAGRAAKGTASITVDDDDVIPMVEPGDWLSVLPW